MRYSIIVPVYNRPDEVNELLESLTRQEEKDFEVVIVEDGSKTPCQKVCDQYAGRLDLHYFMKPNSGPGQSRNYGAERAKGDYLLILDSDVVLPEGYLTAISKELDREPADAFGGLRTQLFHTDAESHFLQHDLVFHHRWHPGRKEKT